MLNLLWLEYPSWTNQGYSVTFIFEAARKQFTGEDISVDANHFCQPVECGQTDFITPDVFHKQHLLPIPIVLPFKILILVRIDNVENQISDKSCSLYIYIICCSYGRMGLDGKPRPINLNHARNVVNPRHDTRFAREELINQVKTIREGKGWREESTGLQRLELIETRRHWFTREVLHDTQGTLNVLNLVEGREARVYSPMGLFDPFLVHYAETLIIPACVGPYCIALTNDNPETPLATIKAYIRRGEKE